MLPIYPDDIWFGNFEGELQLVTVYDRLCVLFLSCPTHGATGGMPCRRSGAVHRIGQRTKHVLKGGYYYGKEKAGNRARQQSEKRSE